MLYRAFTAQALNATPQDCRGSQHLKRPQRGRPAKWHAPHGEKHAGSHTGLTWQEGRGLSEQPDLLRQKLTLAHADITPSEFLFESSMLEKMVP